MAAEIKNDLNVETVLVEGSRGIFDVRLDGQVVYSKAKSHKFPDPGEVSGLLRNKL